MERRLVQLQESLDSIDSDLEALESMRRLSGVGSQSARTKRRIAKLNRDLLMEEGEAKALIEYVARLNERQHPIGNRPRNPEIGAIDAVIGWNRNMTWRDFEVVDGAKGPGAAGTYTEIDVVYETEKIGSRRRVSYVKPLV